MEGYVIRFFFVAFIVISVMTSVLNNRWCFKESRINLVHIDFRSCYRFRTLY